MREDDPRTAGRRRDPLVVVAVALAMAALLVLAAVAVDALLLVFGAALFAQLLRAGTEALSRNTPLPEWLSLGLVVVVLLGVLVGVGALLAPSLSAEIGQMRETMPGSVEEARAQMQGSRVGRFLVDLVERSGADVSQLLELLGSVKLGSSLRFPVYLLAMTLVGLFFAAAPRLYRDGLVRLFPVERRERAAEVLHEAASTLRWWIVGQSVAVVVVGTLVGVVLSLLGVPLALLLAVVVGLLTFIPYVGPFLGLFPVLLVTLLQVPDQLLPVVVAYALIQGFEGYFLTPMVQSRAVRLPPAVTITSQFAMGMLVGPFGVALATPLAAVLLVVGREVYVRDVLGDESS